MKTWISTLVVGFLSLSLATTSALAAEANLEDALSQIAEEALAQEEDQSVLAPNPPEIIVEEEKVREAVDSITDSAELAEELFDTAMENLPELIAAATVGRDELIRYVNDNFEFQVLLVERQAIRAILQGLAVGDLYHSNKLGFYSSIPAAAGGAYAAVAAWKKVITPGAERLSALGNRMDFVNTKLQKLLERRISSRVGKLDAKILQALQKKLPMVAANRAANTGITRINENIGRKRTAYRVAKKAHARLLAQGEPTNQLQRRTLAASEKTLAEAKQALDRVKSGSLGKKTALKAAATKSRTLIGPKSLSIRLKQGAINRIKTSVLNRASAWRGFTRGTVKVLATITIGSAVATHVAVTADQAYKLIVNVDTENSLDAYEELTEQWTTRLKEVNHELAKYDEEMARLAADYL